MYNASGLQHYRHGDWLGSSRLASTPSRGVYYDGAYAPYGENYAESGTTDRSFTGQDQDMVSSGSYPLYDFLMREYHPTWGRWISPDPAGLAAVDPTNPQTWNRYAYVGGNPLSFVDPLGLKCVQVGTDSNGNPVYGDDGNPPPCDKMGTASTTTVNVSASDPCAGVSADSYAGCPTPATIPGPGLIPPSFSSGGGGAGPGNQQNLGHPLAKCISKGGNEMSLQGMLKGISGGKLGNGWLADAFLGNPFSDAIDFFTRSKGSAVKVAVDAGSAAASSALRPVPSVAVSITSTTVTASPSELTVISHEITAVLPLKGLATGTADVLDGFGKLVTLPISITATGFAAVMCGAVYY